MVSNFYIILTVVIVVVIGVVAFTVLSGILKKEPSLLVTSQTFSGKTGDTATLNFEISNLGGDATGVVITASSSAFSEATTAKFDAQAAKTVSVSCQVQWTTLKAKITP